MADSSADQRPGADGIRGRNKKADAALDMESGSASPSVASTFDSSTDASAASSALEDDPKAKKASLSSAQAVVHWWKSMRVQFGDGLLLQIFFAAHSAR